MEIENIAMSTGHGRGHGCEVSPTYVTSKRCAFIIGQTKCLSSKFRQRKKNESPSKDAKVKLIISQFENNKQVETVENSENKSNTQC